MNQQFNFLLWSFLLILCTYSYQGFANDSIPPRHKVTLDEAHIGNLAIDTRLLDSYGQLPDNIRQFYLDARAVFAANADADFTHPEIIAAAQKHDLPLMGGPMLGDLTDQGVTVWLRPSIATAIKLQLSTTADGKKQKTYKLKGIQAGVTQRIVVKGLDPDTEYNYVLYTKKRQLAKGGFMTAPKAGTKGTFRLVFGADFHKIGVHNTNLLNSILDSEPRALMLLGDNTVDDRENKINLHRSDYQLRDVSEPWRKLSACVPIYTGWDDHDYFNNDLSGIPKGFTSADRDAVRAVWRQNWNNPTYASAGINYSTRIGPVEFILLDTRSLREVNRRGEYGSYLGMEQLNWLKTTLKNSDAPFKIISSGTMWSDYISNGKDSWGTWDTIAREEIFSLIETEKINGVLLVCGDRHGARGFTIPRSNGFELHEFEVGTLGGVPGPKAFARNKSNQFFGYLGVKIIAFGEFTFDTSGAEPSVRFRLKNEFGKILEDYTLSYSQLSPK